MTTYSAFIRTSNQILARAFRISGVVAENDDPTPAQNNYAREALNCICKALQNEKLFDWAMVTTTQGGAIGQEKYLLSQNCFRMVKVRISATSTTAENTPLDLVSPTTYVNYTSLANGKPEIALFNEAYEDIGGTLGPTISFKPIPDVATYTFSMMWQRKLADIVNASDPLPLPNQFLEALTYLLAADLMDEYSMPQADRALMNQKAQMYKQIALNGAIQSQPAQGEQ